MKAIRDWSGALERGLSDIRHQFQLPASFPPDVEEAAVEAGRRQPLKHRDRTDRPFVTLDPASSTDLDQAFCIERSGNDLVLFYAIADVGFFVAHGDVIDTEAWHRGETIYLPDGKVRLYPKVLSEGAASLLPDCDRPAILFAVRVEESGETTLDSVERALIRSQAKLGYATVKRDHLPDTFFELDRRVAAAEQARGAARVEPPQQELIELSPGRFALEFRPMSPIEQANASMSLAANLAIAKALINHSTGLFRVMPEPGKRATKRLRHTAKAFAIDWPSTTSLQEFERLLDPNETRQAAMMLAIRRAGERAGYQAFEPGLVPWHSAMAAPYVHATAPLRRLADRYVCAAAFAVANGGTVDAIVTDAFDRLPAVMDRADGKAGQVDSAAIDLAEAVVLQCDTGKSFNARVTEIDQRGARLQLCTVPIVTRIAEDGLEPGDAVTVRLTEVDPSRRISRFDRT